jgi:hypothetical protein
MMTHKSSETYAEGIGAGLDSLEVIFLPLATPAIILTDHLQTSAGQSPVNTLANAAWCARKMGITMQAD